MQTSLSFEEDAEVVASNPEAASARMSVDHAAGDAVDSGLLKSLADAFAIVEARTERVASFVGNFAMLTTVARDLHRQGGWGSGPLKLWGATPRLRSAFPEGVVLVVGELGTTVWVDDCLTA